MGKHPFKQPGLKQFYNTGNVGKIDPDAWGIKCNRCGEIFTMGEMLRKFADRQRDAPPGLYFVRCPTCGKEDYLTQPEIFLATRGIQKGAH